jgi:hypothetical protein
LLGVLVQEEPTAEGIIDLMLGEKEGEDQGVEGTAGHGESAEGIVIKIWKN